MRDRAQVLAEDPLRCQSLPHMTLAGWDLLELIMESKARDYPQWFTAGGDAAFADPARSAERLVDPGAHRDRDCTAGSGCRQARRRAVRRAAQARGVGAGIGGRTGC